MKANDEVRLSKEYTYKGNHHPNEDEIIRRGGNKGVVVSNYQGDPSLILVQWEYTAAEHRGRLATDISCLEPYDTVTDAEVAEVFKLKPEVDWRKVFKEYVEAIGNIEGIDYFNQINVDWTEAEWRAVHELWNH